MGARIEAPIFLTDRGLSAWVARDMPISTSHKGTVTAAMAKQDQTTVKPAKSDLPYRPCAGIMLINPNGLVWIGRRIPKWKNDSSAHIWQMPQGGIDEGEDPAIAAQRELEEETGVTSASLLRQSKDWLHYDLPDELIGVALKGKYRGQKQIWSAFAFNGDDAEVDISGHGGTKAEFDQWRWEHPDRLPDLIVPFKRDIYNAVITEFRDLLAQ